MRTVTIIAAALCSVVFAAPPPVITAAPAPQVVDRACNVKRDIDCPSLQHYCTTCSEDDLNCETDPRFVDVELDHEFNQQYIHHYDFLVDFFFDVDVGYLYPVDSLR
ncbi:hypothetical protein F5B19DRAFT_490794 [Rostrohypoxylon terebratum]|nr:hypothetical protein F5B19DRAFT_490794 [Rostrohypoxylon terebratum]